MRVLRYESERAMREDMAEMKRQAKGVSDQLLDLDDKIFVLKTEVRVMLIFKIRNFLDQFLFTFVYTYNVDFVQ